MDFNPFDLIQNALAQELSQQGFRDPEPLEDPAGRAVLFATDEVAYSVLYDSKKQSFILRSTTLDEKGAPSEWRQLSTWLFDLRSGERSDAESIVNDFTDVVRGPKRVAMVQQRKKTAKGEDRNVDPLFFINRLVGLFPELKEELNREKIVYGQVRYVTFIKSHVVERYDGLLRQYPDSEPAAKLCALLDDMYKSGDLDLRSILTYTLLNGLSQEAFSAAQEKLGDELKKNAGFSRRLIGKTIKPEKKKKRPGKKVEARLPG